MARVLRIGIVDAGMGATKGQISWRVRFLYALPYLFVGLKVGIYPDRPGEYVASLRFYGDPHRRQHRPLLHRRCGRASRRALGIARQDVTQLYGLGWAVSCNGGNDGVERGRSTDVSAADVRDVCRKRPDLNCDRRI